MTNYFIRQQTRGHVNFPDALVVAYSAAGLPAPHCRHRIDAALDAEARPVAAVLDDVAQAVLDPDLDVPAWIEDSVSRLHRASLIGMLQNAPRNAVIERHRHEFVRNALADLRPATLVAEEQLRQHAAVLVSTSAEKCIAAGQAELLGQVIADLRKLGDLTSFLPMIASPVGAGGPQCAVVDFNDCRPARVVEFGGQALNPDPARDGIRAYLALAEHEGPDAAMVAVARGDVAGCTLRVVETVRDLEERNRRLRVALTDERQLSQEWAR